MKKAVREKNNKVHLNVNTEPWRVSRGIDCYHGVCHTVHQAPKTYAISRDMLM